MSDAIWFFGFLHLLLYSALGFSFIAYQVFRIIPGISKVLWQHRNDLFPRYEE